MGWKYNICRGSWPANGAKSCKGAVYPHCAGEFHWGVSPGLVLPEGVVACCMATANALERAPTLMVTLFGELSISISCSQHLWLGSKYYSWKPHPQNGDCWISLDLWVYISLCGFIRISCVDLYILCGFICHYVDLYIPMLIYIPLCRFIIIISLCGFIYHYLDLCIPTRIYTSLCGFIYSYVDIYKAFEKDILIFFH